MVPKKEQAEDLKSQGFNVAVASFEGSVKDIADAATGCDAIVFTLLICRGYQLSTPLSLISYSC